jgi:hypothetical protein
MYKSPAAPLQRHRRAAAQIAATMETGDAQYEQFVGDFDAYSLHVTANLPVEAVERELSILRGMNENEAHPFAKLANALKMADFLRILGRYGDICSLLEGFLDIPADNLDKMPRARLLYTHGYALCKGKGATDSGARQEGLAHMQEAVVAYAYLDADDSGLWMRHKRFYIEMLLAMGECADSPDVGRLYFEKVLDIEAANPYALCELAQADAGDPAHPMSMLRAAIRAAEDHLVAGINVPHAHFALGRLSFAAGRDKEGFAYYCNGLGFFANLPETERQNVRLREMLGRERDYLRRQAGKPETRALCAAVGGLYAHLYEASGSGRAVFVAPLGDLAPVRAAISAAGMDEAPLDVSDPWAAIGALAEAVAACHGDVYMYVNGDGANAETVARAAIAMGVYALCPSRALAERMSAGAAPPRFCALPNEHESLLWAMLAPAPPLDDAFINDAARKAHTAYVESHVDRLWDSAPNMMRWDRLAATYRDANISQIKCAAELFRQNGFSLVKSAEGQEDGALGYADLTGAEREALAKSEHGRWAADRAKDGWMRGKRDEARKRTEYIAPWGELPDEIKLYDYQAVEALFETFTEGGYHIVRA